MPSLAAMAAAASHQSDASLTARVGAAARDVGADVYSWGRATVGGPDLDTATRELKTGQMTGQFAMMIQVAVILAVGVLIAADGGPRALNLCPPHIPQLR